MRKSRQILILRQKSVCLGLKFLSEFKLFGKGPLCLRTNSATLSSCKSCFMANSTCGAQWAQTVVLSCLKYFPFLIDFNPILCSESHQSLHLLFTYYILLFQLTRGSQSIPFISPGKEGKAPRSHNLFSHYKHSSLSVLLKFLFNLGELKETISRSKEEQLSWGLHKRRRTFQLCSPRSSSSSLSPCRAIVNINQHLSICIL